MNLISRILLFACAFPCVLAISRPASAESYNYYTSPSGGEYLTSVPGDLQWHVLYCVDVGTLQNGDILVVSAESLLQRPTTDTEASVELSSVLFRSSSPCSAYTSGAAVVPTDYLITPQGTNIQADEYKGMSPKHAIFEVSKHATYTSVLYGVLGSDVLTVEQGYGQLQILKISGATSPQPK